MALFYISHGDFLMEIPPGGVMFHVMLSPFQMWMQKKFPFESISDFPDPKYRIIEQRDWIRMKGWSEEGRFITWHATDPKTNEKYKEWLKHLKKLEE